MKPYTIEEFLKNGKGEYFHPQAYYAPLYGTWSYHMPAFYSSDVPTKIQIIDGKKCIVFKNSQFREYAVEISELQRLGILKKEEEPMKITSLKEAYIVKCDTKEETQKVLQYIKSEVHTCSHWNYVINHSNYILRDVYYTIPESLKHLPILTFSEWQQLKDKEMNKDKEIIGYKAPYYIGTPNPIQKGDVLKPYMGGYTLSVCNWLPKEIVETWEPVYESIELPVICNRKGVFDREELTVTYGEFKFSVSYLSELKNLFTSNNSIVENRVVGYTSDFTITKKELEEIFKYLDAQ